MSPLSSSEPYTENALTPLTEGWTLNAVRDALRSGKKSAVEKWVTALFGACIGSVERFANSLLRKGEAAGLSIAMDGEDIAVEAFDKVCHLLRGENGDRVRDEIHLLKILFRATRCVWVDAARLPETQNIHVRNDGPEGRGEFSRGVIEEWATFGVRKTAWAALRLLFTDGEGWGRMLRRSRSGVRHYRQYQSLVLYELGERLCDDLSGVYPPAEPAVLRFWRRLALSEICIPERQWACIELAARQSARESLDPVTQLYSPLRFAVESICGADLQNRAKRHVLRHEMSKFLTECRNEIETMGKE